MGGSNDAWRSGKSSLRRWQPLRCILEDKHHFVRKLRVFAADRAAHAKAGETEKVGHSWEQGVEQSSWSAGDEGDEVGKSGPGQIPKALKAGLCLVSYE